MGYYMALLEMLDLEKNKVVRPRHIEYLDKLDREGKIFARGAFTNESGGLVIYIADSYDEALSLAENDPHVKENVRKLDLREWKIAGK